MPITGQFLHFSTIQTFGVKNFNYRSNWSEAGPLWQVSQHGLTLLTLKTKILNLVYINPNGCVRWAFLGV